MKIKNQLLIFGIIKSPVWFWTCMFLSNFWTVKYSSNTLTHKISMKSWHSQRFIYSDLSSLGNSRDLFDWLNTEAVFPLSMDIYLPYFSMRYWLLCWKIIFLGKVYHFHPDSTSCNIFSRSRVYFSPIKTMKCVWLEYSQQK